MKMIREGRIPNRGGVFIDAYNQSINEKIAMTITTRVCTSNHYYITEEMKNDAVEPIIFDDYNQRIPQDQDCIGTLTTNIGSSTPRNGIKIIEPSRSDALSQPIIQVREQRVTEDKQRLEMNVKGTSNTITSVQKDNLVVEPNVLTHKRTEFGKAIRKKYESHEIEMSRHDMTTMEPRTDGVSNTLPSVQKDNYLAIPEATAKGFAEAHEGDSVNLAVPNSTTRRGRVGKQMANTLDTGCQQGVVEKWQSVVGNKQMNPFMGSVDEESPCITSACGAGGGMTPMVTDADLETTKSKEFIEQIRGHEELRYRIRKLTPRECFRLMGVDDADIDKLMNASISNSQLYKCAGNSIVVDVLYHLFRKLYVDKGCEQENFQQTLF